MDMEEGFDCSINYLMGWLARANNYTQVNNGKSSSVTPLAMLCYARCLLCS